LGGEGERFDGRFRRHRETFREESVACLLDRLLLLKEGVD